MSGAATRHEETSALTFAQTMRWLWAQLTSMRTALVLLFLLALASIPGSMVPQTHISPIRVSDFQAEYPQLNRILEPLGMYDVYSSPWFSATYLLLFVSLLGCIIPRISKHLRDVRKPRLGCPSAWSACRSTRWPPPSSTTPSRWIMRSAG